MGTHDGKIAIVTGAGRGIGLGIALALAKEGATVAVAEIDAENGRHAVETITAAGGTAMFERCDVRRSADIEHFVETVVARYGTVDILVNNAMAATVGVPLEQTTDESLELAFRTGPMATFVFMRACHPYLVDGGRVVNIRSGSEVRGLEGYASYVAAKAAVGGITRTAAREWGSQGINVNAIFPFVLSEAAQSYFEEHPDLATTALASLSIQRTGDAEADVGRAVVYLTGPDSGFITGCTIGVDGGANFFG